MSKRGREKKQLHVERIRAKRDERMKAREERQKRERPEPRNKKALGLMPPWKRKIMESIKKKNQRKGT